jgi:AAA family ATP:ADP antiporter
LSARPLSALPLAARALKVELSELPLLLAAAAYFFLLLCGYYVLRPVRDEMAIQSGVANLPALMTATFAVMLAINPLFGWLAGRMRRAQLLPGVYVFFAANLLIFFVAFRSGWEPSWVARAFFIWLSVFNLFVVSVFWSFMADLFSARQAERLFPVVSAGGSAGAICGPLLTGVLVEPLGIANLMPLSAAFILACLGCIRFLGRRGRAATGNAAAAAGRTAPSASSDGAALGGSAWAGIRLALSSPYLLAVCGYIALLTWTSVSLFLQTAGVLAAGIPSSIERTRLFAHIDVVVNVLAFACQLFVTNRIVVRLGLAAGLLFLPLLTIAGFAWLAAAPSLAVLVGFIVARRVGEYAVSRPAREVLFTVLDRESKYKAKNFIDTALTRGGEAASGWTVNAARALGASNTHLSLAAIPIALMWSVLAVYLARRCAALGRLNQLRDIEPAGSQPA